MKIIERNGKYGFVGESGKQIIECKYDYVNDFAEGLATVKLDDKYGFIDESGKQIIECKYNYASSFREGLVAVQLDGKYGFIDKTGKQVIPCKYDDVDSFMEGLAKTKLNDKWGFVDKTGKQIIECKYDKYTILFDIKHKARNPQTWTDENYLDNEMLKIYEIITKEKTIQYLKNAKTEAEQEQIIKAYKAQIQFVIEKRIAVLSNRKQVNHNNLTKSTAKAISKLNNISIFNGEINKGESID